jgi:hypothetical protein
MPARVAVVTTFYRPCSAALSAAERLATYLDRRGHRVVA